MPVYYIPEYDTDLYQTNTLIETRSDEAEEVTLFLIDLAKAISPEEPPPNELFQSVLTVLKNFELLTGLYIGALDQTDVERYTRLDHNLTKP